MNACKFFSAGAIEAKEMILTHNIKYGWIYVGLPGRTSSRICNQTRHKQLSIQVKQRG